MKLPKRFPIICVSVLLPALLLVNLAPADEAEVAPDSFDQAVLPYLQKYCLDCHDEELSEGDLRLDRLPHDVRAAEHAETWTKVLNKIRAGEMPPEDAKVLPAADESQRIAAWLVARLPTSNSQGESAAEHWAFLPLQRPAGDSIDFFIERKLRTAGLDFSSPAPPQRLLRRAYLDLTGLPPTPEQSASFAADPTAAQFALLVDQLLQSPQYGERWGRHWLDLARYADSNGLHEDSDRPHAWRYRDYVIDSFNADKPYGQFICEQLAGDEIDRENPQAWIATGFCRNGPSNEENVAKAEVVSYRLDQLDDMLATTAQVFLGQTIQCARCHNHKLEPFTLTDYYQLLAVFDSSVAAYVPLENQILRQAKLLPVQARSKRKPPVEPHIRSLTDSSSQAPVTHALLRGNPDRPGEVVEPAVPAVLSHFQAPFEITPGSKTTGRRAALARWIASPDNPLTWRVMANRLWQHHFGRGLVDTPNNLGTSGARPTHPELLDWLACELRDGGGRLKPIHRLILLSRTYQQSSAYRERAALLDPENRNLWRYPPHRLEAEVIRDGILAASGNLNFEMGGPGIKPRLPAELLEQSKRNTWPKVAQESANHWRRSVYVYLKRQLPLPMLTLFDAPDAAQSCAVRFASTTPTQALVLLNDEFVNQQARMLAESILAKSPEDAAQIMIERVWAAPATADQIAAAKAFVAERTAAKSSRPTAPAEALADLAVVLFNSSQFVFVD